MNANCGGLIFPPVRQAHLGITVWRQFACLFLEFGRSLHEPGYAGPLKCLTVSSVISAGLV